MKISYDLQALSAACVLFKEALLSFGINYYSSSHPKEWVIALNIFDLPINICNNWKLLISETFMSAFLLIHHISREVNHLMRENYFSWVL